MVRFLALEHLGTLPAEYQHDFSSVRLSGFHCRSRLPAFERNDLVMRAISVALDLTKHLLGGAEVERTNATERSVALRRNS